MIDVVPHLPNLRRYALSLTRDRDRAADLVQDTVARALDKQHTFDPATNLRAWLFTVMRSVYVNGIRSAVRRAEVLCAPEDFPHLAAVSDPDSAVRLREVSAALARLTPSQRRLILRAALLGEDERGYEALARYEGVPVGTVRSRLSRGRRDLRLLLDGAALSEEELALLGPTR